MILLVLWLLLHAPSTTFFSERPHLVSLAVDHEVASRVDSYVLDLLPPEDHANSTRSGYDVSGFLDPVKVIHTVGAFVAVITIAWLALHFILVGGFYACHFGVHAAIALHERRQFPPTSCSARYVYNYIIIYITLIMSMSFTNDCIIIIMLRSSWICVLVKGYKRTESIYLPPNSHGHLLFKIIKHKRGIPIDEQMLSRGVKVIRHAVPLREQGIFNQTTVFLTKVAGKGGGGNHHGSKNDGISGDYSLIYDSYLN